MFSQWAVEANYPGFRAVMTKKIVTNPNWAAGGWAERSCCLLLAMASSPEASPLQDLFFDVK